SPVMLWCVDLPVLLKQQCNIHGVNTWLIVGARVFRPHSRRVISLSSLRQYSPLSVSRMFANLTTSLKQLTFHESVNWQKYLVRTMTWICIGGMYLSLPLLPLLISVLFWRNRYLLQYRQTIRKLLVHIKALTEGPVSHYFQDVIGRVSSIPVQIQGACTQCGNCCLDKRC